MRSPAIEVVLHCPHCATDMIAEVVHDDARVGHTCPDGCLLTLGHQLNLEAAALRVVNSERKAVA